jgi:hypothetical protein
MFGVSAFINYTIAVAVWTRFCFHVFLCGVVQSAHSSAVSGSLVGLAGAVLERRWISLRRQHDHRYCGSRGKRPTRRHVSGRGAGLARACPAHLFFHRPTPPIFGSCVVAFACPPIIPKSKSA